jgi:hypothetical protein
MRYSALTRALGILFVGAVSLSIGGHSKIEAGQPTSAVVSSAVVAGAFGGGPEAKPTIVHVAAKPLSKEASKIAMKLQEKVPMSFPDATSLREVVKYVKQCTVDKVNFPDGIPIYLNPQGLQDSDKTPASTILIDLNGIPLATSLKLALDQLDLAYWIHPDGLLIITSKESEDIPVDADGVILEQLAALREEIKILREEIRFSRGVPATGGTALGPGHAPAGGMGGMGGMM